MDGEPPGTVGEGSVTSGGRDVTSGRKRRVIFAAIAALIAFALLQLWANVGSILTESGAEADPWTVWKLELTSLAGWLVVVAALWRILPHILPPRRSLPVAAMLLLVGGVFASLLHVGVMVLLRELLWALDGSDYSFPSGADGLPYEMRKDVADYVLIVAVTAALRWYTGKGPTDDETKTEPTLEIVDGTRRIRLPHAAIDHVEAAGNYVEVHAGDERHLHRATLSAIEDQLGEAFARIHRSRLVRRDAVRMVETDKSGDFSVTLDNGTRLRGSRRYRVDLA